MADILDTTFEGKTVKLSDNKIARGDDFNIMAKDPAMHKVLIGAGWEVNNFNAEDMDIDLTAFLLDKTGQTRVDEDFIFYNNTETCEGGIRHNGDSRTGAGDGDDESITIDLHKIPFDVMQIVFVLSVYKGDEREMKLGEARNVYLRVVNADSALEIVRYPVDPDLEDKPETAMLVATLNREGPKWHLKPVGQMVEGGLEAVAKSYGLRIVSQ